MKVIFLDIDGVLINREACKSGFGKVDPACVEQLNRITKETNARICLSSCWRIGRGFCEAAELLLKWGVEGRYVGNTPVDWNVQRGNEIQQWLDHQAEHNKEFPIERFVIIDDDSDMAHLMPYLCKTQFETGLTKEIADAVIGKLMLPKD